MMRRELAVDGGPPAASWISPGYTLPRFYVCRPYDGLPAHAGNGAMVAFLAPSNSAVDAAYLAGRAAVGTGEGAPGKRAHYGPGYYGANLRDPDGNNGAIVLGHPLGMSGARLVTTAMYQLHRTNGRYALCTMCIGVEQGIAIVIERV